MQEERSLFLVFKDKGGSAAKKKLSFGEQAASTKCQVTTMAIDENAVIAPGNEVLKRKMMDEGRATGGEKLRLVETSENMEVIQLLAEAVAQPRLHQ